ncbi:MAG: hypothetical protein IKZ25_02770 [Clostridia bacterium]|nr:hypothetical protein [Clostridia bacterium]
MKISVPYFNETDFCDNYSNEDCRVIKIKKAGIESFDNYCSLFEKNGYTKFEMRKRAAQSFAAFYGEGEGIFLNHFDTIKELTIVIERDSNYVSYDDIPQNYTLRPQITQVHLEDFGMSYAIRLSDGRFIVIDGGWDFTAEAKSLMDVLKKGSPEGKPVIAAWFLTHAHRDHYRCFNKFVQMYEGEFIAEKFIFNFPFPEKAEFESLPRYPDLKDETYDYTNTSNAENMALMRRNIEKIGGKIYMAHTGQVYKIGDAICEILSTIDDTIDRGGDANSHSLIFRMELSGQVALWTADGSFSHSQLIEKYGKYLKSDFFQVPHHGFGSGNPTTLVRGYSLVKPKVCLLPVSEFNGYTCIDTFIEETRFLMANQGIDEMITGDETVTLNLPYTSPAYKKEELRNKYLGGRYNAGSNCWIFTGLNTKNKEDFVFSILDLSGAKDIYIELIFEETSQKIENIRTTVGRGRIKEVCIIDEKDVEKSPLYFNWESLNTKKIPENAPFAVRFLSSAPIVVSHKNHAPAYKSDFVF